MKMQPIELQDEDKLNVYFKNGTLEISLCGEILLQKEFEENVFNVSLLFSVPTQYQYREQQ